MDCESGNYRIKPFDGKNFEKWSFKIELLLRKKKIHHVIQRIPAAKDKSNTWEDENLAAMFIIGTHVSDDLLEIIRNCETAFEMFQAIKSIHGQESDTKIIDLRTELASMKFNEKGEGLMEYMIRFRSKTRRLAELGDTTTSRQFIIQMMKTLPNEFRPLRVMLEDKPQNKLTWDYAVSGLSEFYNDTKRKDEEVKSIEKVNLNSEENKTMTIGFRGNRNFRNFSGNNQYQNRFQNRSYSGNNNSNFRGFNRGNVYNNNSNQNSRNTFRFQNQNSTFNCGRLNNNFSNNNLSYNNRNMKCHYCGRYGHLARNCRFKQNREPNSNYNGKINFVDDLDNSTTDNVSFLWTDKCLISSKGTDVQNVRDEVKFYLDSASTRHIVNDISLFSEFIELKEPEMVTIAKRDVKLAITGIGNLNLKTEIGINAKIINVRYSKEIPVNLLSVKRLTEAGFVCMFYENYTDIVFANSVKTANVKLLTRAESIANDLYLVKFKRNYFSNEIYALDDGGPTCAELWHRRLAHLNYNDVQSLKSAGLLPIEGSVRQKFCEPCIYGKQCREVFWSHERKTRFPLELVHTDVCTVNTPSYNDRKYFLTFLDDFSNFCFVYLLSSKTEVLCKFKEYHSLVSNRFNRNIMRLRCDRGTEYLNDNFRQFCREKGIDLEPTMANSAQQNSKAERMNRTLTERARTILNESKLDKQFWPEAITCAAFIINRCPTKGGFIPFNRWYGRDYEYKRLRVFGCEAYRLTYRHTADKMIDKSKKLVFVGYAPGGYRLLNVDLKKIYLSRDVKFNESIKSQSINNIDVSTQNLNSNTNNSLADVSSLNMSEFCFTMFNDIVNKTPKTYHEAVESSDSEKWKEAIANEREALLANDTWTLVPRPHMVSTVSARWVFTIKLNSQNNRIFKARLVARGFEQARSFNYEETYSPVAKLALYVIVRY